MVVRMSPSRNARPYGAREKAVNLAACSAFLTSTSGLFGPSDGGSSGRVPGWVILIDTSPP